MMYVHLDWFVYKILIYLKNAKDGQERVYHSMHMLLFEYNNLKSLVIHSGVPKLGHIL